MKPIQKNPETENKTEDFVFKEKTHFVLSLEQWEAFCEALEAPAKELPGIKKLFSRPSVFHSEKE